MKHNKGTSRPAKELLSDLQALIAEAEAMMADTISEHSAETFRNLRARFDVARERFADTYEDARKKVAAGAEYTDELIRANPYQSIAVAASVGLLIGILVSRRGD